MTHSETPRPETASQKPNPEARLGDIRRSIVDVLEYSYGSWIVAIIFTTFLTLDPSTEVLVGFIADLQIDDGSRNAPSWSVMAALGSLTLLPITAHATAVWTLRQCERLATVEPWLLPLIPLILLFGYAMGFGRALNSPEAELLGLDWLQLVATLSLISIIVVTYWLLYANRRFAFALYDRIKDQPEEMLEAADRISRTLGNFYRLMFMIKPPKSFSSDLLRGAALLVILIILLLAAAAYIGFFEPGQARAFGPIGIVACFGIYACLFFAWLTTRSYKYMPGNAPLILLPITIAFAVGSFGSAVAVTVFMLGALLLTRIFGASRKRAGYIVFGGTALLSVGFALSFSLVSECRSLAGCNMMRGAPSDQPGYETVAQALRHLPDAIEGKPLRVVAAQGGGLYAAYHTAYYLAARADTEPGFTESLYAISGVSGGSVGAGVYWAVRTSGRCPTPGDKSRCHRDAVDDVLRRDYLTPSVATLLFRDLLDTFLPISAMWEYLGRGPIDRGHVLENELLSAVAPLYSEGGRPEETALYRTIGESAFVGRTDPAGSLAHPLLFFNSTQVDNGAKVLISPVASLRGAPANLITNEGHDLRVINGMVNSARFPFVTPPARIAIGSETEAETIQLVDGGYFDNSGIETALDIILDLHAAGVRRPISLIIFTADEKRTPAQIKGMVGAPVTAFTSAWRARRDHSDIRVGDVVRDRAIAINLETCRALADAQEVNFTVSWYLSAATFDNLRDQIDAEVDSGDVC